MTGQILIISSEMMLVVMAIMVWKWMIRILILSSAMNSMLTTKMDLIATILNTIPSLIIHLILMTPMEAIFTQCNNTKFVNNTFTGNDDNGLTIDDSNSCKVFYNFAIDNDDDGFFVSGSSKANTFQHNFANLNDDHSFDDNTSGKRTEDTANTYEHNECPTERFRTNGAL